MSAPSKISWVCPVCRERVDRHLVGPGVQIEIGDQAPDYVRIKIGVVCPKCSEINNVEVGNRPY